MKVTLFNNVSPSSEITVIRQNRCPESLLRMCNVPDEARSYIKNCTDAVLLNNEGIFVRGINSSFYEVEINKEKYFVHEQYVRRDI